jgi:hypothetical protein
MLRGAGDSLGRSLTQGEEYELDDRDAIILVGMGKATQVEPTPAGTVETREPVAEHRDPMVRRGTRRQ